MRKSLLTVAGCWALAGALQAEMKDMKPYVGSAEFERIKQLVGRWEGATNHAAPQDRAVVEYQVTSGGTAIVEKLMPGTPHEMVSVYHDTGGKPSMTHYCMMPNHPELTLKSGDADSLEFVASRGNGFKLNKDPHMHALTITWKDPDNIVADWQSWENGKPKDSTVMTLARVKVK